MAGRPITDVDPRETPAGASGRRAPARPGARAAPAGPPAAPGRRPGASPVVAMMAVYAGVFAWLSVARHRSFSTGRFDLGNMVQALWSTADGRFFATTDVSGVQFNRLGAHVDLAWSLSPRSGGPGRARRCCWSRRR